MARWDPGTEQRLRKAALELFQEHGYDNVTVTHIAERAGITRRSYFRYFPDKREVLFAGSDRLPAAVAEIVLSADERTSPLRAALSAVAEAGTWLAAHVEHARERRDVIDAAPELQERGRTKLAAVAAAIRQALEQRGVAPDTAEAVAQLATIAFANAFGQWIDEDGRKAFPDYLETATTLLRNALADKLPAEQDG